MDNKVLITNYLGDHTVDPIQSVLNRLDDQTYFSKDESGLYNVSTGSVVKIKDNGMIDIFVDTNQGIRIDPNTSSVNFFTNNEKHTLTKFMMWAEKNITINTKRLYSLYAHDYFLKATDYKVEVKKHDTLASEYKVSSVEYFIDCYVNSSKSSIHNIETDRFGLVAPRESIVLGGKSLKELDDEIDGIHNSITDIHSTIGDIQTSINSTNNAVATLGNKANNIEENLSSFAEYTNATMNNTTSNVDGLNSRITNVESTLNNLVSRINNMDQTIVALIQQIGGGQP